MYNTITLIESSGSEREVHLADFRLVSTQEGNERYIYKHSGTKLGGRDIVNVLPFGQK